MAKRNKHLFNLAKLLKGFDKYSKLWLYLLKEPNKIILIGNRIKRRETIDQIIFSSPLPFSIENKAGIISDILTFKKAISKASTKSREEWIEIPINYTESPIDAIKDSLFIDELNSFKWIEFKGDLPDKLPLKYLFEQSNKIEIGTANYYGNTLKLLKANIPLETNDSEVITKITLIKWAYNK